MNDRVITPLLRFTLEDAERAADEWGFNCGPGVLCAVTGKTPAELRPHLLNFEKKGYTNASMMALILHGLGVRWKPVFECAGAREAESPFYPVPGLVRVQFAGPWTRPGVPVRARYRKTHWIATRGGTRDRPAEVFDINAISHGGWRSWEEWTNHLVPWLLKRCVPKADGRWWPTHSWEIKGGA